MMSSCLIVVTLLKQKHILWKIPYFKRIFRGIGAGSLEPQVQWIENLSEKV